MPYMLDQYNELEPARWSWWSKVFSPDECQRIITIGESLGMNRAKVSGKNNLDLKKRNSWTSWVDYKPDLDWLFEPLAERVFEHNKKFFGYHLSGFKESLQITKYTEGGFYNWHQDRGLDTPFRKLSMVINLSDPDTYDGGELEIFSGDIISKELGMMTLFSSFEQHRVRKVTRGTRYSLVTWIHGPRLV